MAPRAFETLIELNFSNNTTREYFFERCMTEREVHDALDPLLEEYEDGDLDITSPIVVGRWVDGRVLWDEFAVLSRAE